MTSYLLEPTSEIDTFQDIKSIIKLYPDFSRLYVFKQPIRSKIPGYESRIPPPHYPKPNSIPNNQSLIDSLRRTKTTISDLTLCNKFDQWVTFTFNCRNCNTGCKNFIKGNHCTCGTKCQRTNAPQQKIRISKFLKNQREIHGHFDYLIVPEFHKKDKSLHFHALMKGYKGQLTPTTKTINGRKVYNIKSYQLGFSTLINITDISKVSSYIKKYITKDMPNFKGKKRYWCSTGLERPVKITNPEIDPFTLEAFITTYNFDNITILTNPVSIEILSKERSYSYGTKYRSSSEVSQHRNQEFKENWERLQTITNTSRERLPNRGTDRTIRDEIHPN